MLGPPPLKNIADTLKTNPKMDIHIKKMLKYNNNKHLIDDSKILKSKCQKSLINFDAHKVEIRSTNKKPFCASLCLKSK